MLYEFTGEIKSGFMEEVEQVYVTDTCLKDEWV